MSPNTPFQTKHSAELCTLLVNDTFGELPSVSPRATQRLSVAATAYGRPCYTAANFAFLREYSRLSPNEGRADSPNSSSEPASTPSRCAMAWPS